MKQNVKPIPTTFAYFNIKFLNIFSTYVGKTFEAIIAIATTFANISINCSNV